MKSQISRVRRSVLALFRGAQKNSDGTFEVDGIKFYRNRAEADTSWEEKKRKPYVKPSVRDATPEEIARSGALFDGEDPLDPMGFYKSVWFLVPVAVILGLGFAALMGWLP